MMSTGSGAGGPFVALVLPPTQSFFMPYSAPAVLAAWLQSRHAARTLVVDAGMEWLARELAASDACDALARLRSPETYRDIWTLQRAYVDAETALADICAPWTPERVELSGRYFPPVGLPDWAAVRDVLGSSELSMFDDYYATELLPKLASFGPDVIGLSVPFDWMLLPTMRLTRRLKVSFAHAEIIVGGHAVNRLWHEKQREFFELLGADWVAVGDGEGALGHLMHHLKTGAPPPAGGPLVHLPADHLDARASSKMPEFLTKAVVPDFSDLTLSSYLRPSPILSVPASDGCFFGRCNFCSRQRSDQSIAYVERSAHDVADVMAALAERHAAHQFILAEDIVSHRFMLDLACLLTGTNMTWFCEASFKAKMARRLSPEDCTSLYNGGCRLILNGLESASARMRNLMGCPVDLQDYDRNMARLVDSRIVPYVTMIFGYPGETSADVHESVEYMRRHVGHAVFSSSRFWVVPGTPLADELQARPGASCVRRSVFDGGLEYADDDTLDAAEADEILRNRLAGAFGPTAQFTRSIPVLMQMLDKIGGHRSEHPPVGVGQREEVH